jgi:hypothetical protein
MQANLFDSLPVSIKQKVLRKAGFDHQQARDWASRPLDEFCVADVDRINTALSRAAKETAERGISLAEPGK